METIVSKEFTERVTLSLVKGAFDSKVVKYFDSEVNLNNQEDIAVRIEFRFPTQRLDPHYLYIHISQISTFLSEDQMRLEHIDTLPYNEFECYYCMNGLEDTLWTHPNTNSVHFHKECYSDLADFTEYFIEDNQDELVVQNL